MNYETLSSVFIFTVTKALKVAHREKLITYLDSSCLFPSWVNTNLQYLSTLFNKMKFIFTGNMHMHRVAVIPRDIFLECVIFIVAFECYFIIAAK